MSYKSLIIFFDAILVCLPLLCEIKSPNYSFGICFVSEFSYFLESISMISYKSLIMTFVVLLPWLLLLSEIKFFGHSFGICLASACFVFFRAEGQAEALRSWPFARKKWRLVGFGRKEEDLIECCLRLGVWIWEMLVVCFRLIALALVVWR